VRECLPLSKKIFEELFKKELDKDISVEIVIDVDKCLDERIIADNSQIKVENYDVETGRREVVFKNEDDQKCFAGIVLCNDEGNIICKNTFDVRVDLCF
jgi:V-type H+-transporting ATPase subunit E